LPSPLRLMLSGRKGGMWPYLVCGVNLRLLLRRCPPCFHQRRQSLASGGTHRLATNRLPLRERSLLWQSFPLLLCPPRPLCSGYFGSCCLAHGARLPSACFHCRTQLGWTASACGLGT